MTSPILVTGGTGTLGRQVVPLLQRTGCDIRVLSRRHREPSAGIEYVTGDLLEGAGIDAAVEGAAAVVHLAGGAKDDDVATRILVRAASAAGTPHLVHISVVGADRMPLRWFRSKLGAEQAVIESGLPWTVLRAAQFHGLVLDVVHKMAKLPVIPTPGGLRFEPVDAGEVAARVADLAQGGPAGRVADLAGPTVYDLADIFRSYLTLRGKHRMLVPVRMPGKAGRAYRAGDNLAGEGAQRGQRTWEDLLDTVLRSAAGWAATT